MKIKIEFSRVPQIPHCCAQATIEGMTWYGYGESWSQARDELRSQIKKHRDPNYIPRETIVELAEFIK